MKGVLSLGKRDAFQPRTPGFLLPVPTEQERALSLAPWGQVGENPGNEVGCILSVRSVEQSPT